MTLTPLYGDAGKIIAVATTERDVGERVELDALRIQTNRLLKMVEHLPTGAVFRENNHLLVNRAVEKITGYDRKELATLDLWFDRLYGKQSDQFRRTYERDRDAGFPSQSGPVALWHKSGERRYVEYAAYRFDDHEVWIMYDVSKQFVSETALRDREERLRAVMDNAAEAIIVIESNGPVTDFNNAAEKAFGYRADEVVGQNVNLLMPSPYREAHDDLLARYLRTGVEHIINHPRELPGRRKDGSTFPLLITVNQVDHLGVFVGLIHDLSTQKALEKQIADISTAEREHFGQEIHDGICQQLTGIRLIATSLQHNLTKQDLPEARLMEELVLELQQAVRDARALSRGLAPVPVTPEGLKDAFILLARDVMDKTGIECLFEGETIMI